MKFTIRKMTLEDVPAVIDLDRKSFSLPWPERSFRFEVTENPASRCWVADLDGNIVGMIVVWLIVDEAHVATIATHPDYRRQGIAQRLLAHALRQLLEEGARSSFLEVRASNFAAQEMYRKFGYEESGRRRRYYRDNDEDAILMTLDSLKAEGLVFGDKSHVEQGGAMSEEQELEKLTKQIVVCTKCELHRSRKKAVPGEGPSHAEIMFIGEGPGFHENEQGRPFVGAAGQFLDQLLEQAGVTRSDVWITNVVKCRPPGNRDPLPEEIETCTGNYLQHQIEIVNPSIIVTLGRFSMGLFFKAAKITQIHGQMRKVGDRYVIAMYHPAAALHQMSLKPAIMEDFAKLPELLKQARAGLGKSGGNEQKKKEEDSPKQMSLF